MGDDPVTQAAPRHTERTSDAARLSGLAAGHGAGGGPYAVRRTISGRGEAAWFRPSNVRVCNTMEGKVQNFEDKFISSGLYH